MHADRHMRSLLLLIAMIFVPTSDVLADKALVLGVHPYKSATELQQAYSPLVNYLSRELGMPVELQISPNYEQHIERIGKDMVDIAYMGPASYVELVEKYGPKPLIARQFINGKPTFHGKIIARQDSAIRSITNLEGKRFAFGDPESTMSHLVPQYMLQQAGIHPAETKFLGSHNNVALAVLSGDFDAGAVKEEVYEKYASRGLKAIASTPALSEHLFVARSTLDTALIKKICTAFFTLKDKPDGATIMGSIKKNLTAFGEVSDHDYDNLRHILSELKQAAP